METPFVMGQTYWKAKLGYRTKEVPCPVCFGKLAVVVTLGNGEHIAVKCDACAPGFGEPSGTVSETDYSIGAEPFIIEKVSYYSGDRWSLLSTTGVLCDWKDLYETEEEALKVSQVRVKEEYETDMKRAATNKQTMIQKKSWTVQYHGTIIKELLRRLEWHRAKIWDVKNAKGDLS